MYQGLSSVGVLLQPGRREDTVLRCLSFDDGTDTALPSTSRVVAATFAPQNEVGTSNIPRVTSEEDLPRHRNGTGTSLTLEEPRYWDMCHDDDVPPGVSTPPYGHPDAEEQDVPPGVPTLRYGHSETEERDVPPRVSTPPYGHPDAEEQDVPPGVSTPPYGHPETEERDVSTLRYGPPGTEERDVSTLQYGPPGTEERDVSTLRYGPPGTEERDVSTLQYGLPNMEERDVPPYNQRTGTELGSTANIGAVNDTMEHTEMRKWEVTPTDYWDEPRPKGREQIKSAFIEAMCVAVVRSDLVKDVFMNSNGSFDNGNPEPSIRMSYHEYWTREKEHRRIS
ncbi:hypothetical protein GE061_000668, partial [Apolygus lucorum]